MDVQERPLTVFCVGDPGVTDVPSVFRFGEAPVRVERVSHAEVGEAMNVNRGCVAAALIFDDDGPESAVVKTIRADASYKRTRLYVISRDPKVPFAEETHDVEAIIDANALDIAAWVQIATNAVRAYDALGDNPTVPYYFLDAKYDDVFTWFEKSRWDISEAPSLEDLDRSLISDEELSVIKHATIAEFGTLPGAHNFLREWRDEYGFSSWALSWGAEEARHSLLLCRYLRAMGVEVMAKHAMYKRTPYDEGPTQASTLMMNIVSETRAAELYGELSGFMHEPAIKKIWALLSKDEARHASAFFTFCRELCAIDEANLVSAMEQAYVWLGDRRGLKHPSGFFYPHTPSEAGFNEIDAFNKQKGGPSRERADERVLAMIRKLTGDERIDSAKGVKRWLRERL